MTRDRRLAAALREEFPVNRRGEAFRSILGCSGIWAPLGWTISEPRFAVIEGGRRPTYELVDDEVRIGFWAQAYVQEEDPGSTAARALRSETRDRAPSCCKGS